MKMVSDGDLDAVFMADGGIAPTDALDRLFPDYWKEPTPSRLTPTRPASCPPIASSW